MDKRTEKRRIGDLGESVACEYLKRRGHGVLDRNYLRKWGEIDIVTSNRGVVHFIEVKSVTHVTHQQTQGKRPDNYRPEDNMHPWKLKRLARTIQTYLLEKNIEGDWQLDLVTVYINTSTRQARVEMVENIII